MLRDPASDENATPALDNALTLLRRLDPRLAALTVRVGLNGSDDSGDQGTGSTRHEDETAVVAGTSARIQRTVRVGQALGSVALQRLLRAVAAHPFLTALDLRDNGIGAGGVAALSRVLASSACMVVCLEAGGNAVGAEGAASLSRALERNGTLTELGLRSNGIGAAGAGHLASALRRNVVLTSLDLADNDVANSRGGPLALAQALGTNSTLLRLDLSSNNLTDGTGVVLAKAAFGNRARPRKQPLQIIYTSSVTLVSKATSVDDHDEAAALADAEVANDGAAHGSATDDELDVAPVALTAEQVGGPKFVAGTPGAAPVPCANTTLTSATHHLLFTLHALLRTRRARKRSTHARPLMRAMVMLRNVTPMPHLMMNSAPTLTSVRRCRWKSMPPRRCRRRIAKRVRNRMCRWIPMSSWPPTTSLSKSSPANSTTSLRMSLVSLPARTTR